MSEKFDVVRYLIYLAFRNLNNADAIAPDTFEALRGEGVDPLFVDECYDAGMTVEETYQDCLTKFMGIPAEEEETVCDECDGEVDNCLMCLYNIICGGNSCAE